MGRKVAKAKEVAPGIFDAEGKTTDSFGQKVIGTGDNGLAKGAEAQELSVESQQQLVDSGQGEKLIMRVFEFSYETGPKIHIPSKQHLFNQHAKLIRDFLWKDGLEPAYEAEPRVVISKRQKRFRIFVLSRARFGHMWNDNARTLQDITQNKT